jgi:hypothetical protein
MLSLMRCFTSFGSAKKPAKEHGGQFQMADPIDLTPSSIENQRSAKLVRCASAPDGAAKALIRVPATPEAMTIYKAASLGL